jgi:hypothetical protein
MVYAMPDPLIPLLAVVVQVCKAADDGFFAEKITVTVCPGAIPS